MNEPTTLAQVLAQVERLSQLVSQQQATIERLEGQAAKVNTLPTTTTTTSRRRLLRKLAGGIVAGMAVGGVALVGSPATVQARIVSNPAGTNNQIGAIAVPPGKPNPPGTPSTTIGTYLYGLVATDGNAAFSLGNLGTNSGSSFLAGNMGLFANASGNSSSGVRGQADGDGSIGVYGETRGNNCYGVFGTALGSNGVGVYGATSGSNSRGLSGNAFGQGSNGVASIASGNQSRGVSSVASGVASIGVYSQADGNNSRGVYSQATGDASIGMSTSVTGDASIGVYIQCSGNDSRGVIGLALGIDSIGVVGLAPGNNSLAGYFGGPVQVIGTLTKSGGSFKIDHPRDPANQYLYHSFVESPDMMNIYNGVITLDEGGQASVELPDWFETLNRDFRYQLTPLGQYAPVYISQEVEQGRFKIAGGSSRLKVSWQVTGIRQDAWANAHRIPVEETKPEAERGTYLHPELYGHSEEKGLHFQHQSRPVASAHQQGK